jgi:antitoxin HicB
MKRKLDHTGSSFDSFLEEEGIREEVEAVAMKRVIAWEFEQAMQRQQKTKLEMARALHTSRSQLDRLLDPTNAAVSLETVARAAKVLGKSVHIELRDAQPGAHSRKRVAPTPEKRNDKALASSRSGSRTKAMPHS